MPRMNRRTFLKSAAALSATASLPLPAEAPADEHLFPENGTLIPDDGWHLWIDDKAAWKDDAIFLPEDVHLDKLPVNPPTGGWAVLEARPDKIVTLPATVEQHFWGKFGSRSYTAEEYRYGADDPVPQNGAYFGVSWWSREIDIPATMQGKRIFLHIRGARLRAEVYLNQKLVGYSIMEELPIECDLTAAANPGGRNHLAIRITNPAGRFDWVDGLNFQWGAVKLYRSHGFSGLDRGMTLSAHKDIRIADAWVLNTNIPNTVSVHVRTEGFSDETQALKGIHLEVLDAQNNQILSHKTGDDFDYRKEAKNPKIIEIEYSLTCPNAQPWDLDTPKLYRLRATATALDGSKDTFTTTFGFRWFAPSGLGKDAIFRLNGRRIKLYSSISWGFWGLNGLWPTPELAEKEVTQAKKLGLNCLNFHRNLAKEDVLRAQDRLGLLRYMEPGAGKLAIGKLPAGVAANANSIVMEKPTEPADIFAQRYMFTKCVLMVRAFRGHTSVIQYTLQNEIGADLKNPDTLAVLAAMRAEDPSRSVALNDGFSPPPRSAAQAWYEPYNPKLHRSDQEEWAGWWNNHQGAGDQWYDAFYKSPTDFTYRQPLKTSLVEFGEMEGCAVCDNHSLMIDQILKSGGASYDLEDHKQIVAAYNAFLDRWHFRSAFPTAENLFLSIGRKCYESWQQYMENARINDETDYAVISGWESTAIENHSGIVDNLRNFKSDPKLISSSLLPIRPVAKQRALCVAAGEPAVFDLYLFNDTTKAATGTLHFSMVSPGGTLTQLGTFPAPTHVPEQFSYLVKEAFTTPPLTEDGIYRFKLALDSTPDSTQTRELWVTRTQGHSARVVKIGVSGISASTRKQLAALSDVKLIDFTPGIDCDLIVSSGITDNIKLGPSNFDETGTGAATKAAAPISSGKLADAVLAATQAGTPLLVLAQEDALADGIAKQLAAAGAFTYAGQVGATRAPWMGNWYFLREHPVYNGLPQNQAMGIYHQSNGKLANGLLVDGPNVDIFVGYSRDHDRRIGAGTFTSKLGKGKLLFQRVPEMHPVLQQRWLVNTIAWLTA